MLKYGANPNQYEKYTYDPFDHERYGLHDGDEMHLYYHSPAYTYVNTSVNHVNNTRLFEEWHLQCPLSAALKMHSNEMVDLLTSCGATSNRTVCMDEEDEETYYKMYPMEAALACKFNHVSETLKNDKDFILKVVEHNYRAIGYVSDVLKADREIVMAVVSQGKAINSLYINSLYIYSLYIYSDQAVCLQSVSKIMISFSILEIMRHET